MTPKYDITYITPEGETCRTESDYCYYTKVTRHGYRVLYMHDAEGKTYKVKAVSISSKLKPEFRRRRPYHLGRKATLMNMEAGQIIRVPYISDTNMHEWGSAASEYKRLTGCVWTIHTVKEADELLIVRII